MMNNSITFDIERKYTDAVKQYELEIYTLKNANIEEYANLSFLYWSFATELFEFNIPNNIPDELQNIGVTRFSIVLNDGLKKFPESVELNFWKKYFEHRMYFSDFTEEECLGIIHIYSIKSLVPYFYLNLLNEDKYGESVKILLNQCVEKPTAKNLYIKSFFV